MKSSAKKLAKSIVMSIPYLNTRLKRYDHLNSVIFDAGFIPGHFYSAIPDLKEVREHADSIFREKVVHGIEMNTEKQLSLLEEFKVFYRDYPYNLPDSPSLGLRYRKEGAFYSYSDSVFLYCMIRKYKPRRIIEVGSGHSSAIMLDVNDILGHGTSHVFIDPNPERLDKSLRPSDLVSTTIHRRNVQDVELDTFQTLEAGDFLFVDSTHVSKVASDVNFIFFEVLPILKPGVFIHFHDIFHGFEYPRSWLLERRWFWNENYILRAFLMYNRSFEIHVFNSYLHQLMPDWFEREMPECMINRANTGGIWLRKTAD